MQRDSPRREPKSAVEKHKQFCATKSLWRDILVCSLLVVLVLAATYVLELKEISLTLQPYS